MQNLDVVTLVLRWLHIVAAMALVGGTLMYLMVHRQLRDLNNDDILQRFARPWAPVVHGSIAVLLITGFINFYRLVIAQGVKALPYHPIFLIKLILALIIFFVASAITGRSPGFADLRAKPGKVLTIAVVMGIVIVLLSGLLSQIRTVPPA